MADTTISIGLDLESIVRDARKAATYVQNEFQKVKPKISIETKEAASAISVLSEKYKSMTSIAARSEMEIKNAMAQLIISGQKGTEEYRKLEEELKRVKAEASKLSQAFDEVEKGVSDVGEKAAGGFLEKFKGGLAGGMSGITNMLGSSLGAGLLAGAGVGIAIEGVKKIGEAFTDLYKEGLRIDELNDQLNQSFMQAGMSAEQAAKATEFANETARNLAFTYGVSKDRFKELIALTASLGGVVGEQNQKIVELAFGIEQATQGMVTSEQAIRAFTKGLADPEGADAINRLITKFPQLASVMKGTGDMSQKVNESLKLISPTLQYMKKDFEGADSTFKRFSMMIGEIKERLAEGFFGLVNKLITPINEALKGISFEGIEKSLSKLGAIFTPIIESLKGVWNVIHAIFGGIKDAISSSAKSGSDALGSLGNIASKIGGVISGAFENIRKLLAPIGSLVGSILGSAWKLISGLLEGISKVFGAITKLFGSAQETTGNFFDTIGNALQGVVNIVNEILTRYISAVVDGLKIVATIISGIVSMVADLANWLKSQIVTGFDYLAKAVKSVYDWIVEAGKWLYNQIAPIVRWVANLFSQVYGFVKSAVVGFIEWTGVLKPIKSLIDSIYQGIKSAVDWIVNLANKVGKFFAKYFSSNEAKTEAKESGEKLGLAMTEGAIDEIKKRGNQLQGILNTYLSYSPEELQKNKSKIQNTLLETQKFLKSIQGKAEYQDIFSSLTQSVEQVQNSLKSLKPDKSIKEGIDSITEAFKILANAAKNAENVVSNFEKSISDIERQKIKIGYELELMGLETAKDEILKNEQLTEAERLELAKEYEIKIANLKKEQRIEEINFEAEQKIKSVQIARDEALEKINIAISEAKAKREARKIEEAKTEEDVKKITEKLENEKTLIVQRSADTIQKINELKNLQIRQVEENTAKELTSINQKYAESVTKALQETTKAVAGFGEDIQKALEKIDFSKLIDKFITTRLEAKKELNQLNEDTRNSMKLLQSELAKGGVSYAEYVDRYTSILSEQHNKTSEILKKQKSEWQIFSEALGSIFGTLSDTYIQRVGQSIDTMSQRMDEARKRMGKNFDETAWKANEFKNVMMDAGTALGFSMMEALAKGENASKKMVQTLLQLLPKIVATYATEIFGFYAKLGPWMIPAALATIGTLYGLMRYAYAAKEGYMKGVREKRDRGPEDTQLVWINPEEVILTPEMKRKNKEALEYMFRTGGTLEEFYSKKYASSETKIIYDVINKQVKLASEIEEIKNILNTTKFIDKQILNKEIIFDTNIKQKNKEALEYIFRTGGTLEEFYSKKYAKPETKILYDVKIQQTELASELKEIKQILKTTKLVDVRNLNKIVIEDNRKVQVQKYEWVGR